MSQKLDFNLSIALSPEAMTKEEMAELLDSYIAQLQEAKARLLSDEKTTFIVRLNKSKKKPIGRDARMRIADAQRARWAKLKAMTAQPNVLESGCSSNEDPANHC